MKARFINGRTNEFGSPLSKSDIENIKVYIDEGTIVDVKEDGGKWFKFDGKNGQTGVTLYRWRFKILCKDKVNPNIEIL